jgi:tripartite ATP-independent transporter DctM subunit
METALFVGFFIVLILLRCPVAYAMLLSSAVFLMLGGMPLLQLTLKTVDGVEHFTLLAIPMFLFAGNLMNSLGVTDRIFGFASACVRHITGGLGHVNVLASVIFAGMSGSAVADAGGLGAVEIKAMREAGYDEDFSAAITAASATIGPVIPPSITMVVYGFLAEESVGKLFLGGVFPGLLMALCMSVLIYFFAKTGRYKCPVMPRASLAELWTSFRRAILPVLAPVILVGGILLGLFTPTEGGVVVVIYVLCMGIIYLNFNAAAIMTAMQQSIRTTAATLFIIATSMIFGWIITVQQVPDLVTQSLAGYLDSQWMAMLFIITVLLILGTFMEVIAALILIVPTLLAIGEHFAIDPILLGVVTVLTMMIGTITPPVGLVLFTVMQVANMSIERLVRAVWPFYFALLAAVLLTAFIPAIALWLPNLVFVK